MRPKLFDVNSRWFAALGLSLLITAVGILIGFKLFYSQYFESYKKSAPTESFENIIDIQRLKSAIEKRENFIKQQLPSLKDPSV